MIKNFVTDENTIQIMNLLVGQPVSQQKIFYHAEEQKNMDSYKRFKAVDD